MIRKTERYETMDGWLFEGQDDAIEHAINAVREIFAERMQPLVSDGKLTHSERFTIIMQLLPNDFDSVAMFINKVANIVNY